MSVYLIILYYIELSLYGDKAHTPQQVYFNRAQIFYPSYDYAHKMHKI